MGNIRLKDKEFKLFIPEKLLKEAIANMACHIKKDLGNMNPLFVGILNGAFMFTAELMSELNDIYELTFARYSSYKGLNSSGSLNEVMPLPSADIKGRTIVLLEDVIDTGFTMYTLINKLQSEGATDVRLATMLFKPKALMCNLKPDYVGIEVPNDFIVGHGLDYKGAGRALRDIYIIANN
ncbi:phosphoribosyltransferase [Parabacteroides pacaensis]|uniref:phosphoribosyltransferase n=1 Tax=Parabacteroides pacaensis TaxID=2086575 RepID=UPI000D107231|nr:phosphoribosyltransferase family protein [Parabacteroides pacaensis]